MEEMLIRNWLELLFLNSRIWTGSTLVGDGDLENSLSRYHYTLTNLLLDAHASLIAGEIHDALTLISRCLHVLRAFRPQLRESMVNVYRKEQPE